MGIFKISLNISPAPGIVNDLIAVIYKTTSPAAEVDRLVKEPPHDAPYNFQFNDLEAGIYLVKIHESPDGVTLGNLRHDFWVNSVNNQILFERRFYRVGGSGDYDPADGTDNITDPYFSGKTISGIFKEGFRYLRDIEEWEQESGGVLRLKLGIVGNLNELWSVEITYTQQDTGTLPANAWTQLEILTEDTTLDSTFYNKIIYTRATGNKIVITTPNIATIPEGKGFMVVHDGGNAINTVLQLPPGQIVRFKGQDRNNVILGKGESVKVIKKVIGTDDYLFATDKEGQWDRVGEVVAWDTATKENALPAFDPTTEYDLTVYVRLAEFIDGLPAGATVDYATYDSTTTINGETGVFTKRGFIAVDAVNNKARMPDLRNLYIRFLKNNGGADSSRVDNKSGGYMHWSPGEHYHNTIFTGLSTTASGTGKIAGGNDGTEPGAPPAYKTGSPVDAANAAFTSAETTGRNIGKLPFILI